MEKMVKMNLEFQKVCNLYIFFSGYCCLSFVRSEYSKLVRFWSLSVAVFGVFFLNDRVDVWIVAGGVRWNLFTMC